MLRSAPKGRGQEEASPAEEELVQHRTAQDKSRQARGRGDSKLGARRGLSPLLFGERTGPPATAFV